MLAQCHCLLLSVCVTNSPHFSVSLSSVTPRLSQPSALWCEICKCSPFAETLPDWQQNISVASPLSVTHQSSANHLSHSVTPPAARRQACTRPSSSRSVSQPPKPPAWSESERNNIPTLLASPIRIHLMLSEALWVQAESKHWWLLFAMGSSSVIYS